MRARGSAERLGRTRSVSPFGFHFEYSPEAVDRILDSPLVLQEIGACADPCQKFDAPRLYCS